MSALSAAAGPSIVINNNHEMQYSGPVTFGTSLPDGFYKGTGGVAYVSSGTVKAVVNISSQSEIRLSKQDKAQDKPFASGPLSLTPAASGVKIRWQDSESARIDFGLVVIPGQTADYKGALSSFKPLSIKATKNTDGTLVGNSTSGDYKIEIKLTPYASECVDIDATITRFQGGGENAYVGLVRRVSADKMDNFKMRWDGIMLDKAEPPTEPNPEARYTRGLDWCSWQNNGIRLAAINRFAPGSTTERQPGRWIIANNFLIREYISRQDNSLYLVSEIAGGMLQNAKSKQSASNDYTQPLKDEPVKLSWRLALDPKPATDWEESQFYVYAGYKMASDSHDTTTVDLGTPYVQFGTSYFPYSTMTENFDFYRTPGLDRETWWPFSPKMWENWRAFLPQMQTDLRIIKAMGFDWVRLHHLELLGQMDRSNAVAFLDAYTNECRKLDMKVLIDTLGSNEWMTFLAGRYKDVVKRIEIENEILIPGITPGAPERWTACYNAAKKAAPDTDVFLTGINNNGIFERLVKLGVPFDRVGLHNYKHGPGYEESNSSIAVAVGGYGSDLGKAPVLGEFNWKQFTEYSPEARTEKFIQTYGQMLKPRAIPEFFQFHWQETMSVNPFICRQGIRHYETIYLDRTPKPEGIELMKFIKKYARDDASIKELPITIDQTKFEGGKAKASFTIENRTAKKTTVQLSTECFGDISCRVISDGKVTLEPDAKAEGTVEVELKPEAKAGTYHFFVKAGYTGKTAYGWGIAKNQGAPQFDASPILTDLVDYPQGASIVEKIDWRKPVCIAFGTGAPIIDMEMAYMVYNTLQSATGRAMRLCGTADIPADLLENGNLVLVGSAETNKLIAQVAPQVSDNKGTVIFHDAGKDRQWLLLTGEKPEGFRAAATDFVLRYWKNAKDSSIRVTGIEKGAALGNKASVGEVNPP